MSLVTDTVTSTTARRRRRHPRALASVSPPPGPTASPRCRAASPTRPTCGPRACSGATRCGRRTRRPASSRSTSGPPCGCRVCRAVLTAADVPGRATFGLERHDQPVLASDVVRYEGEAVAVVAADHPETARLAAEAIVVEYEVTEPLVDAEAAIEAPPIHPDGNVVRHLVIRHGEPETITGDVIVEGTYEVGMQDQAPLGTEAGHGGADRGRRGRAVRRHAVAPRRPDPGGGQPRAAPREGAAASSPGWAAPSGPARTSASRSTSALLALHTGRPVKMVYDRAESFFGHVHRHPARMWYRHHAAADGTLVKVEARLVFDGGAYVSSSPAVIGNAACFAVGPYRVPNALIDGWAMRTNNPPCGAMRGFGAVQTCFAHEAQMDKLAAALGMDPVELRLRNALATGDVLPTGQVITGTAPVAEVIRAVAEAPDGRGPEPRRRAHGSSRRRRAHRRRRRRPSGSGFRRRLQEHRLQRGLRRLLHRSGPSRATDWPPSPAPAPRSARGSSPSPSRSPARSSGSTTCCWPRPTPPSARPGPPRRAVRRGCRVGPSTPPPRPCAIACWPSWPGTQGSIPCRSPFGATGSPTTPAGSTSPWPRSSPGRCSRRRSSSTTRPTEALDADGQGDAHLSFAFVAHRAVVDVDPELGLTRLVDLVTAAGRRAGYSTRCSSWASWRAAPPRGSASPSWRRSSSPTAPCGTPPSPTT